MPKALSSFLVLAVPLGCASVLGIDGNYVSESLEAGQIGNGGLSTGGLGVETGGAETGGAPGSGGNSSGGREMGGTASGGIVDTGGLGASGGASGGAGGAGSCDADGASCPSGQKCCPTGSTTTSCVDPLPIVGCENSGCAPCAPPPANGIAVCTAGQCDFECGNNTVRNGNMCESNGAGGASGTGGAPTTPPCKMPTCKGCGLIGPFPCCRNDMSCGCTYAPGAACY